MRVLGEMSHLMRQRGFRGLNADSYADLTLNFSDASAYLSAFLFHSPPFQGGVPREAGEVVGV